MIMFTGIITSTGKIKKIEQNTKNRSAIKVSVDLGKDSKGLKIGQSVALNGVCPVSYTHLTLPTTPYV